VVARDRAARHVLRGADHCLFKRNRQSDGIKALLIWRGTGISNPSPSSPPAVSLRTIGSSAAEPFGNPGHRRAESIISGVTLGAAGNAVARQTVPNPLPVFRRAASARLPGNSLAPGPISLAGRWERRFGTVDQGSRHPILIQERSTRDSKATEAQPSINR
jgi:hypothetical protein